MLFSGYMIEQVLEKWIENTPRHIFQKWDGTNRSIQAGYSTYPKYPKKKPTPPPHR